MIEDTKKEDGVELVLGLGSFYFLIGHQSIGTAIGKIQSRQAHFQVNLLQCMYVCSNVCIHFKLRMLSVPAVIGPTNVFCDNLSIARKS